MECNALCEIFDRNDVGAVGLAGEQDARVHRLISQLAVDDFAQDHSAGAAVAFGASLLGANGVLVKTKVVEEGQRRRNAGELHPLSSSQEPDLAPHAQYSPYTFAGPGIRTAKAVATGGELLIL